MASAVDSRLAYARLSAVATASRLPTANRGSNNSYTTSWDTTRLHAGGGEGALEAALDEMMSAPLFPIPRSFLGAVRTLDALAPGKAGQSIGRS